MSASFRVTPWLRCFHGLLIAFFMFLPTPEISCVPDCLFGWKQILFVLDLTVFSIALGTQHVFNIFVG